MSAHDHLRRRLVATVGEDIAELVDMYIATAPIDALPPELTKAQRHKLNAAAWRSESQRRRAGYSNAKQAQRRRELALRVDALDFDPFA